MARQSLCQHRLHVCRCRSGDPGDGSRGRDRPDGPRGAGHSDRVHGSMQRRTVGQGAEAWRRQDPIPEGNPGDRGRDPAQPHRERSVSTRARARPEHPVLHQPGTSRPRQRWRHQSGPHRVIRRPWWLRSAREGADNDEAQAGHRGSTHLGPPRSWWCRLSGCQQVVVARRLWWRHQVRRCQRRRGRPRCVHGSHDHGRRSPSTHRGHRNRRLRHGCQQRIHLRTRRVPPGYRAARSSNPCGSPQSSARTKDPRHQVRPERRGSHRRRSVRVR